MSVQGGALHGWCSSRLRILPGLLSCAASGSRRRFGFAARKSLARTYVDNGVVRMHGPEVSPVGSWNDSLIRFLLELSFFLHRCLALFSMSSHVTSTSKMSAIIGRSCQCDSLQSYLESKSKQRDMSAKRPGRSRGTALASETMAGAMQAQHANPVLFS